MTTRHRSNSPPVQHGGYIALLGTCFNHERALQCTRGGFKGSFKWGISSARRRDPVALRTARSPHQRPSRTANHSTDWSAHFMCTNIDAASALLLFHVLDHTPMLVEHMRTRAVVLWLVGCCSSVHVLPSCQIWC